ncbi:hypothetical protein PF005_g23357 [Phytophthora fragariae]|uniref:B box-type domain-containing protein n=1 Tax=Phytophthora fragariae TaxID=53985 RepID=A0A6A3WUA6_9STRA|nr:hypothetical protein PF003_g31890 [Phytophthora fragariae]KAE8948133.1 hypothetical protein PF009_g2322 [Phytophthora fragariae]KAE8971474.1 hypothetical protein PF011_g26015 [Phytophthora fragariae]KAE9079445.1 hypothetical protein PF007_g23441 [Phytophthora fragariae]KAE9080475.1 hypothetical protein PF010_g22362 [Phytophthora fragariae]
MQPLEEQEDPSFASVQEPAQLQRPHCDQCRVAIADYECQRCVQHFCRQCELDVHHRLAALAMKHEESKGDGRPHQEFLKWISACQECGQKTMEFFCVNCHMYQCENCCASKHLQPESHFFFCVEGSSPRMFPFASWNLMFVEMVKMSKGDLQDKAAAAEVAADQANKTAEEVPEEKYSATAAARVKMEKAAATPSDTAAALGNLSLTGTGSADIPQSIAEEPESQAKPSSRVNTTSIVDLTLDDDSDSQTSTSSHPPSQPQIEEEVRVKSESAWLTSATAAQENPVLDVDELMEKLMGDDEDPILRSMVGEYNQHSEKIYGIKQDYDEAIKKTKELSSAQPMDMNEVRKASARSKTLRQDLVKAEKARDGVVANIVMYLKFDPEELNSFLETCTADVPYAQDASHRKCGVLEANIRSNLENIQRIQRNMDELINMKKDAFEEVKRLGAEIAQGEEEVRQLDKERQKEFLSFCQFSKRIQTAVREMAAGTQ